MSRRWKIALTVSVALTVAGLVSFFLRHSEPTYRDKSINAWLDDWAANKATDYRTAVREIGMNGLPYAVRNLARNNSKWHNKYRQLQPRFPRFFGTSCQHRRRI